MQTHNYNPDQPSHSPASQFSRETILDCMIDPVVVIDREMTIVFANRAAYLALRMEPEERELQGTPVSRLVRQPPWPDLQAILNRVLRGRSVSDFPITVASPEGREAEARVNANLLRDRDNNPYVVAVLRDLSQAQRDQEMRIHVEKMAGIGQLASGVAHEFNNLLAIMQGYAQFALGRQDLPPAVAEALDNIVLATRRAAEITRNLLDFAQPAELLLSKADVVHALESAVAALRDDIERSRVKVLRDYGAIPLALVDANQIEQALINIITNAIQAMPKGGELRLRARLVQRCRDVEQPTIEIEISDSGQGIPPEHLHRVFDPFFTTKGARSTTGIPGTGLGLSVAHGIIMAHLGEIRVASKLGHGTTFTIRLPVGAPEPAAEVREKPPPVTKRTRRLSVLVVDDEVAIRGLLTVALQQAGHNVVAASDGLEALQLCAKERFDVAIVDILMPGMDGLETMRRIHENDPTIPVIVTTGKGERDLEAEALQAGARAYLRKPFGLDTILETVDKAARPASL